MIKNYVTLKSNNKYYRLLRIDEGKDRSIYIWRGGNKKWYGKFSYHHGRISGDGKNFGYQRHQKIRNKLISESIRYSDSKLQNKRQVFQVYHWYTIPSSSEIKEAELGPMDLIFEINELIEKYEVLISVNREDLLHETEFFKTKKCNVKSADLYVTLNKK